VSAEKDIDLAAEQGRALAHEMRALEGEIGRLREAIAVSGAKLKEDLVNSERQTKDSQQQSQEREAQARADVRNAAGWLGAQLEAVVGGKGRHVLAGAEMLRATKQLGADVGGLKQRVEVLQQESSGFGKRMK
jgi:hypothetical protein